MTGAGHLVNINDISGPYSGILLGISNTIATIPGIISPYVAGVLTPNVIILCYFDWNSKEILVRVIRLNLLLGLYVLNPRL